MVDYGYKNIIWVCKNLVMWDRWRHAQWPITNVICLRDRLPFSNDYQAIFSRYMATGIAPFIWTIFRVVSVCNACVCIQLGFFLNNFFLLQKEHAYRISFIGLASWDAGNKIYVHADELVTPLHHTQESHNHGSPGVFMPNHRLANSISSYFGNYLGKQVS